MKKRFFKHLSLVLSIISILSIATFNVGRINTPFSSIEAEAITTYNGYQYKKTYYYMSNLYKTKTWYTNSSGTTLTDICIYSYTSSWSMVSKGTEGNFITYTYRRSCKYYRYGS